MIHESEGNRHFCQGHRAHQGMSVADTLQETGEYRSICPSVQMYLSGTAFLVVDHYPNVLLTAQDDIQLHPAYFWRDQG